MFSVEEGLVSAVESFSLEIGILRLRVVPVNGLEKENV